jgi:magnesium-protoporphyrin IX monomethyl ester (oxidative) cyclase
MDLAKRQGGVMGAVKNIGLTVLCAATFVRLYFLPTQPNVLPEQVCMAPVW